MTDMSAELAVKSEEVRQFHADQEYVLNQIRYLVGQPGDVVNKARLFDDDFRRHNGEAHAKKIVKIMCRYDTAMTKTLGPMRKLLEP